MMTRRTRQGSDELAAHHAWVRAVALRLVSDAHLAEDVAQQAWLVALRRPPPGGVGLRRWLSGIVRNLARTRRRDVSRRDARRAELPVVEGPGSTDELVAQAELESRVSRLVLALGEPERSIVLLRYREDLSSAEIGARLGMPAGTVRWHLKRAIERLRERLDARHGGDRRAWAATLSAGLVRPPLIAPFGGLVMKTKLAAAAAALVVLAGAGAFLWTHEPDRPAEVDAARAPASEDAAPDRATAGVEREVSAGAAATPDRTAADGAAEPQLPAIVVRGRCVDASGAPLAGVACRLAVGDDDAPVASADSRADGTFEVVAALPEGRTDEHGQRELTCSRSDRVERTVTGFARDGEPLHFGDVVLRAAGTILGRVVDDEGFPVGGARVGCVPAGDEDVMAIEHARKNLVAATRSAADGSFRIEGAPPGWWRVRARGDGTFFGYGAPVAVEPGRAAGPTEMRVERLTTRHGIEGVVIDADGRPLPGVELYHFHEVRRRGAHLSVTTDDDGRFRILAYHDVPYRLSVHHDGLRAEVEGVRPGTHDVELELSRTRRAHLMVTDAETGRPLRELRAFAVRERGGSTAVDVDHAPAPMPFWVPDGRFSVRVAAPFHHPATVGPFDPGSVPDPILVALAPRPPLEGRVTRDGAPVAGADVRLFRLDDPMLASTGFVVTRFPSQEFESKPVRTGADGRFAIDTGELELVFVRVEADGAAPAEHGPIDLTRGPPAEPVEIELSAGGTIEGVVRVPEGRSRAGLVVAASRGDGRPLSTRTDAGGRYRLPRLIPGPWQVELRDDQFHPTDYWAGGIGDHVPVPSNCVVRDGEIARFDLSLLPRDRVVATGRVALGGAVRPGWRVELHRVKDEGAWRVIAGDTERHDSMDVRGTFVTKAEVSPDGTYRIEATDAGPYVLEATNSGIFAKATLSFERLVTLSRGEQAYDFAPDAGRVEGTLPPASGDGVARERRVELYHPDPAGWRATARLRLDGDTFTVPAWPAGELFVTFDGRHQRVVVPAGGTAEVDFTE